MKEERKKERKRKEKKGKTGERERERETKKEGEEGERRREEHLVLAPLSFMLMSTSLQRQVAGKYRRGAMEGTQRGPE